jgi:hypothetical protein
MMQSKQECLQKEKECYLRQHLGIRLEGLRQTSVGAMVKILTG